MIILIYVQKKAVVQHLYLGRNPPLFTEMRVLSQCSDDDHVVDVLPIPHLYNRIIVGAMVSRFNFAQMTM